MAHTDVSFRIDEGLPLLRRELVEMGVDVFDRPELRDQLAGADFAHALDSRYIVRCVAAYGKDLNDLLWPLDPVFFTHLVDIDELAFAARLSRLVLDDVRTYELTVVLVRRDHVHLETFLLSPFCHRTDHIVGLISLYHQHRELHRPAQLAQRLE